MIGRKALRQRPPPTVWRYRRVHVDTAVKDAGRMILNGAVVDNSEEWIFENEGETWGYDRRKNYNKHLPELFSGGKDEVVLDLLTPALEIKICSVCPLFCK